MMLEGKEKNIIIFSGIFVVLSFLFVFSPFKLFSRNYNVTNIIPEANDVTGQIGAQTIVEEDFIYNGDSINQLAIIFHKIEESGSRIAIEINQDDIVLFSETIKTYNITDQHRLFINMNINDIKNKKLTLKIYSLDNVDTGLALMINDRENAKIRFGSGSIKGTICFSIN